MKLEIIARLMLSVFVGVAIGMSVANYFMDKPLFGEGMLTNTVLALCALAICHAVDNK